MKNGRSRAENYRIRAEELRALAEMDEPGVRYDALMNIARDYERIAQSTEAVDDSKRALSLSRKTPS